MVNWTMNGNILSDKKPPSNMWGFIYRIDYTNGKSYIGKKQFWSVTKKPFGKKKLAEVTDKRAKKYEMVVKENNWRRYVGSSKLTEGLEIKQKAILEICSDKINLTYCEQKWLMKEDVLVDDTYLNDCIGGKFYSGRIKKGK